MGGHLLFLLTVFRKLGNIVGYILTSWKLYSKIPIRIRVFLYKMSTVDFARCTYGTAVHESMRKSSPTLF